MPYFSALFTGMAGKLRNRRLAEVEMKQWTVGAFFMSPHGSKGWGRAMCVNTHAQRPVFRAERNWLVNAKFLLNAGCQLKREKKRSNIEKAKPPLPLVPGTLKSLPLSYELAQPAAF